jgi:hypothetical protein
MGTGNPLLKSYDQELYQPKTYYIDFHELVSSSEDYDDEDNDNDNYLKEQDSCEYFRSLDFFDIDYTIPQKQHEAELTAEYRGNAYILAEFEFAYLVSTSDSELNHYAIGMVPKFKYEDIVEQMQEVYGHRKKWYDKRALSYDDAIDRYSLQAYRRKLKLFKKESENVMRIIHDNFGSYMSARAGAWTSYSVKSINKSFKFL